MKPGEIIAMIIVALIIGGAVFYIIKAKKSGKKCIGCPDGCSCGAKKNEDGADGKSCACCHCHKEKEN